jgi:hypothetical protein
MMNKLIENIVEGNMVGIMGKKYRVREGMCVCLCEDRQQEEGMTCINREKI